MAQIRQEINLIDHLTTAEPSERIAIDTTQYNGTVSYYLEVVFTNTNSAGTFNAYVYDSISSTKATLLLDNNTSSFTLKRSTAFTPNSGLDTYYLSASAFSNITIKSARIVIIQSATTLTNTETQIEIGNYNLARTTESAAILTNPKYWKYDAAKWDGTKTFYAEAVYNSGDMDTISVYLYESAAIDAPSWSAVATIVSAATTTVPTRTRVAFTPVDGRWYTIFSLNGSMDNHDIYRAGVVVQQADGANYGGGISNPAKYSIIGGNNASGAQAQSFKILNTSTVTGVKLWLAKLGSPTDTLNVDIVSSLGGSSLANATISSSTLNATTATEQTLTFASPVSLTGGSTYYIQLTRSPDTTDAINYIAVGTPSSDNYSDGARQLRNAGSWSAQSDDLYFQLIGQSGITKLEPQYLLANTLLAAGTALQTFLTDWDSTEWDDGAGSIAYTGQAEAANGSTSDVLIQEADAGSTVATINNIDNAGQAAATMPSSQNLDCLANANAGDVAAVRILVAYVFSAEAPATIAPAVRTARKIQVP